jgi:hypothetical protein
MKTTLSYSKAEHAFLLQAAKARANELREQAIDDFFAAAGDGARRALRAANRFAHSLVRHARLRGQNLAH